MSRRGIVPKWTPGDRIRKARKVAGMGQTELAQAIEVAHSTVASWESDPREDRAFPISTYEKIAEATGVSAEWLAFGDPATDPDTDSDRVERAAALPPPPGRFTKPLRSRWSVGSPPTLPASI